MNRILTILIALMLMVPAGAQQQRKSTARKAVTTQKSAKTATQGKKQAATSTKKKAATPAKTAQKGKGKKGSKQSAKTKSTPVYTNSEIRGLQNQRAQIKKKIQEQERLLKANKADVKQRLSNLLVINSEIDERKKSIEGIQREITHIEGNIDLLKAQLSTLEQQLNERKDKYVKSLRYMARHRNVQDQLMFIFSAKNLGQMYRRLRFVREYAAFQRAQGELVKAKQDQITAKQKELQKERGNKNTLLRKDQQEHDKLQTKQAEQQEVVTSLQKQQKTIQGIIDDQRKKDQELNATIDRLIAEEVEKARARAAEEARKKAAAEAAAKKKRAEELARKKAAAEAAARENQRRIAEAREREVRAKRAAREAARRDAAERERAEREALQAQAEREAAERKAEVEKRRHEREVAEVKKEESEATLYSSVDRKLSNNFVNNKGRLPIPITGKYRIVSHYGQYNVEGLNNVRLDNKGINILGSPGAQARAIFDGEVTAVANVAGTNMVLVRHGSYISVYCNLSSVVVHRGQRVSTRQVLGTVGADNILQFQLRRETSKLNPEIWLGR